MSSGPAWSVEQVPGSCLKITINKQTKISVTMSDLISHYFNLRTWEAEVAAQTLVQSQCKEFHVIWAVVECCPNKVDKN